MNFNKSLICRVISIILIISLSITSACYGIQFHDKGFLRIPILGSEEDFQDRFRQALLYNNLQAQGYTGRGIIEQYCKQKTLL